jgi:hypothetical protein
VSFFEGGRTIAGTATVGSSLFASGSIARQRYDNPAGLHLDVVGGSIGYEITLVGTPVSLCPVLAGGYGYGYEVLASELTSVSMAAGLGVGFKLEVEPNVFVVPGADLSLVRERQSVDLGSAGIARNVDVYGVLTLSLGFLLFRQRGMLGPAVQIPIASDGGSVGAGVALALSIGGRS